ncbi:DUF1801 domain-containing protein [Phenylobacterium sp.]|uniref:DUF1801 domain-containing protein n=1 Tax=Phenylobacterium sp. TaxID=1871053 RepID=UPI002FC699E9
MSQLFRLSGAVQRDPEIEAWFSGVVRLDRESDVWPPEPEDELRRVARTWFEQMRGCGADVRELMHDGCPVACVEDAPFGYVNAFKAHVNVGFFCGAMLDDPEGLLEGAGKRMRHVKIRGPRQVNADALRDLIAAAYEDIRMRLRSEP